MPIRDLLVPEFDEEMKNTRKILDCVPDGKFDYKPHEKSMTLGRLASHVAELPGWVNYTLDRELLAPTAGHRAAHRSREKCCDEQGEQ